MSARGSYKKRKKINEYTLKFITTKITGYKEEDNIFNAVYQEIKRLRRLIVDTIPSLGLDNLKEKYENKVMFMEYIYKDKEYRNILDKMYHKEKLTNEELIHICLLLQHTNLYTNLILDDEDTKNTFKFISYLGHIDSTIEGIRQNLIELFLRNSELAIEYSNEYISTIDKYFSNMRNRLFIDALKSKNNDNESEGVKRKKDQLMKELEEETIYIDCNGKTISELDLSKYDDLSKIVFYNSGDIRNLIGKNENKEV